MRGSRIFRQGEGGGCGPFPTDRNSPDNVFVLCCFFSPHLILQRGLMVYFEEYYTSPRFQGVQHFLRDPIFSGGCGVLLLIPLETYRTCDFRGGSLLSPFPAHPLDHDNSASLKLLLYLVSNIGEPI